MVFYRMMALKRKDKWVEFGCFNPAMLYDVDTLDFNYEYFDHMVRIRKWHKQNAERLHLTPLSSRDLSRLNPLAVISKTKASNLYQHPFVKEYTFLKFRQNYIYILLVINLLLTW